MKNSEYYGRKIHKLHRSLKRKYAKVEKPEYEDPTDAMVYAMISEHVREKSAQARLKRIHDYFVDWNDLRVSREQEIVEILNEDLTEAKRTSWSIVRALGSAFKANNTVHLVHLRKMGKRQAKETLEKLDEVSHFVVNYCMLTSLDAHAIPLTASMIEYLRQKELVNPESDERDIEGFLTRQISTRNAYEFYQLLRNESESRRRKAKSSRKTTTRTKRKTKRRKTKNKTKKKKA